MSTVNFKIVQTCSKILTVIAVFIVGTFISIEPVKAWEVDFSRRQIEFDKVEDQNRMPASVKPETKSPLEQVFETTEASQDIVILNTEKGFVPEILNLRQGGNYKIHVVNVNEQKRNISFIVDAFGEHHNTIYGEPKSFQLAPKTEGIFSYQCPETAFQGKIVVIPQQRKPASAK